MKNGELDKAETIYSEILASDDKNFEAYEGLITIYKKKNLMDKMVKITEMALSKGYIPEDDSYYMDVFNYYKDSQDRAKLEKFVENYMADKELPKDFYEEDILAEHPVDKGEIIDMKYGDIDGNGKEEMMVLSATESGGEGYDINSALIDGNALKVYSNTCKQSYYIGLSRE